MKSKPKEPEKAPPVQGGLTKVGWDYLVTLFHLAGYKSFDKRGRFIVSKQLCEDLFAVLEPNAPAPKDLTVRTKGSRASIYRSLTERIKRLQPGHSQETVEEDTLIALSRIEGFKDPRLFDEPGTGPIFRQVAGTDPYSIDFRRFCRKLMVAVSSASQGSDAGTNTSFPPAQAAQALNDKPTLKATMYLGGISFLIGKSFGYLQLVPEPGGLRLLYCPVVNGVENTEALGYLDLVLPLEAVGALHATAQAYLEKELSLDENVILQSPDEREHATLVKLYRDKPIGENGQLSGKENCWLRLVTGPDLEQKRRILLMPRDLICWVEACRLTGVLAAAHRTHQPMPVNKQTVLKTIKEEVITEMLSEHEREINAKCPPTTEQEKPAAVQPTTEQEKPADS